MSKSQIGKPISNKLKPLKFRAHTADKKCRIVLKRNRINSWRAMGTRTDPRLRRGVCSVLVWCALYEDQHGGVKRRNAFFWHEMCFFLRTRTKADRAYTFNIYRPANSVCATALTEKKPLSRYLNECVNHQGGQTSPCWYQF